MLRFGKEAKFAKFVTLLNQPRELVFFLGEHGQAALMSHRLHQLLLVSFYVVLVYVHVWEHAEDMLACSVHHIVPSRVLGVVQLVIHAIWIGLGHQAVGRVHLVHLVKQL